LDLPELHNAKSGRLDALRIAAYLDVPLTQLATALGRKYQALHKTPDAPGVQPALAPIKTSLVILHDVLGDRSAVLAWLNSPHPNLEMRAPLALILAGQVERVMAMLVRAATGIPS
jgi:hypothetical protein